MSFDNMLNPFDTKGAFSFSKAALISFNIFLKSETSVLLKSKSIFIFQDMVSREVE